MIVALLLLAQTPSLTVPAFTGYIESGPEARINRNGVSGWTSAETVLLWGGWLNKGTLRIGFDVSLPAGEVATWSVKLGRQQVFTDVRGNESTPLEFEVAEAGWHRITLQGRNRTGDTFGDLRGLQVSGSAVEGAQFNLKERRNSASVHLSYTQPKGEVEWFYNEVKAETDPLHTFYMACGFSRGYFGMQVNSPTERRIIFSVWDSGDEAVDRNKVDTENRVQLIEKGPDVYADSFGNEGTGGHSHLKYIWKKGETQRFLLRAQPQAGKTLYSAYYRSPEMADWRLIAKFLAPKDGGRIRGGHSFIENFWGTNGHLLRRAEFGPAWFRTTDGQWHQSTEARFTHDATGGKDRFDYDFGTKTNHFWLQNGGFEGTKPGLGTRGTCLPGAGVPDIKLPE